MMELDNFHRFESRPLAEGEFFLIFLSQRKKDIPDLGKQRRILTHLCVDSEVGFVRYKAYVVDVCQRLNARAYIYYMPRRYADVQVAMIQELAQRLTGPCANRGLAQVFESCAAKCVAREHRTWLVDIDVKDEAVLQEVRDFINDECVPLGDKIVDVMETRSGYHLITRPFHLLSFQARYPDIDLHRNAATLLYAP